MKVNTPSPTRADMELGYIPDNLVLLSSDMYKDKANEIIDIAKRLVAAFLLNINHLLYPN
jgi:hypothetical protein